MVCGRPSMYVSTYTCKYFDMVLRDKGKQMWFSRNISVTQKKENIQGDY